jgi:adenosylcobinamide kinase/adenosylcobinamide-phosphate guanylyltransferase
MSSSLPLLVLGGARSGKSAFAEQLLLETTAAPTYLATATAEDDEMKARIERHQHQRGQRWHTLEEPIDIIACLTRETDAGRGVLVDCLTLWLSNLFMRDCDIGRETGNLAAFLAASKRPIVLVSNELGLGLVPETKLGRDFRDAQGQLNQKIAAAATTVVFVAAGLPLYLKGAP